MKPGFYLPYIRVKLKLFSPFCSLCVIFVILIRIYRMGKSVHARERAREGFARNQGKALFKPEAVIPIPFGFFLPGLFLLFLLFLKFTLLRFG